MPESPTAPPEPPEDLAPGTELEAKLPQETDADYGAPFDAKDFGGQFVWASSDLYEAKILRVRAGKKVIISTRRRKDMVAMLTGGRGVLEVIDDTGNERIELHPGDPMPIAPGCDYRLVAITEIELFTVHSPDPDAQD
jgi:hypothetical protein